MEIERLRAIKREDEKSLRLKEAAIQGRENLIAQMHDRHRRRIYDEEIREREKQQVRD